MEQIKRILHHHFGRTTWEIARAKEGQQNAGYRARNGGGEVFVKVTDAVAALQRLGEIAVAPGVLASGSDQGRTYVIQEYITGNYPDGQWIATHLPILASCIRRYHDDQPLTALLSQSAVTRYHERVALDLAQLEAPLPSGRQRASMNVALSSTIFWQRWQKRAIPMLVFHHDERKRYAMNWSNEGLRSVRSRSCPGDHLSSAK